MRSDHKRAAFAAQSITSSLERIQAVSIDERPGLVAEIIAVILAGVEPPPAAATPVPKAGMT